MGECWDAVSPTSVARPKKKLARLRPSTQDRRIDTPLPLSAPTRNTAMNLLLLAGNAAYTRANAIVFPESELKKSRPNLPGMLSHELFHVLSRAQPDLRHRLYATIGFVPCNELEFPSELSSRKLTNPDAPLNDHRWAETPATSSIPRRSWPITSPSWSCNNARFLPPRSSTESSASSSTPALPGRTRAKPASLRKPAASPTCAPSRQSVRDQNRVTGS
jgi:hypothetical protein